jgi:hypothetical protein
VPDEQAPVFGFTGSWPFNGEVTAGGNPIGTVTSWTVSAPADGLPLVTLTLLAPGALALALSAAEVVVDDRTREALKALGWAPPPS